MSTPKGIEQSITAEVLGRMQGPTSPRLREVMTALITHLHDFVREVRPSEAEWMQAIAFLTQTGQKCDDKRQEYILLSDVLGVSMLVDAIVHRKPEAATESTVFGPFYTGRARDLPMGATIRLAPLGPGEREITVEGCVRDLRGAPVEGATLEVWQTAPNGMYDIQEKSQPPGNLRGTFTTGSDGTYRFRTLMPVSYPIPDDGPVGQLLRAMGRHPWRPAHIHFLISAPGCERLITHVFTAGDRYLDSDAVFGVKPELIAHPVETADGTALRYDFVLEPRKS